MGLHWRIFGIIFLHSLLYNSLPSLKIVYHLMHAATLKEDLIHGVHKENQPVEEIGTERPAV